MSAALKALRSREVAWEEGPSEVVLGVDIIELVSSSLYVDPLSAYREYIQNAADAIDDARAEGTLSKGVAGRVDIMIDTAARSVRIRDNGTGLGGHDFVKRLTAFGGSQKRGKQRRGFRGVGRLAAVGYCQELFFRSRTGPGQPIRELRWDCRYLRSSLRSSDFAGTLGDAVREATSHRTVTLPDYPDRFFEVELRGVVRHGKDDLLSVDAVRRFISQVAPVPFSPQFQYGVEIDRFLSDLPTRADLHVFINGEGPIYRPHRDAIEVRPGMIDAADELQLVTIPAVDGGVAAKGWILHHAYLGAIPRELGVRGLRLRSGNVQIGDDSIVESTFVEIRFNAWAIGEFHILDSRIIPNGRRDQYEQNVHVANVLNHLAPIARDIGNRCRLRSQYRQMMRRAENLGIEIENGLTVLQQGAVTTAARSSLISTLKGSLVALEKIANNPALVSEDALTVHDRLALLRRKVTRAAEKTKSAAPLAKMTPQKRRAYEDVFSLIYDCASDVRGAKELVDRVLARIKH